MKRFGFTLTEVLITLGIVGVVAALTIPAMTENVSSKHVGPALAKAINNLENANRKALNDAGAIRLKQIGDNSNYFNVLSTVLNGNLTEDACTSAGSNSNCTFISNDGISYEGTGSYNNATHKTEIIIDINGPKKPNENGIDQFEVTVTPSGELELGDCAEEIKNNGWEYTECTQPSAS